MDYERKYKQLHKFITDLYPHLSEYCKEKVEGFFPKLKESENERIRKVLVEWFESYKGEGTVGSETFNGIPTESIIAWLEKQGGQTGLAKESPASCALSFINYLDTHRYEGKMCVSNGECEDIENAFHNAMWDKLHRYYCRYIEKQDKQKPADKVKLNPEILKDTWFICTCTTCSEDNRIWFYKGVAYLGGDILKYDLGFEPEDYQDYFRLWTIQDAKDGDVLFYQNGDTEIIMIFKSERDAFHAYTHFQVFNNTYNVNDSCVWCIGGHPATKEQRNFLLQKMKEAGYEWDANKKELKITDWSKHIESKIDGPSITKETPVVKTIPKFKVGDVMRTLQEADDNITSGLPVVVSIDNQYYHCTNELIAIKDQDDYEYPPMNSMQEPTDKVEPKFKVGEWLQYRSAEPFLVEEITEQGYTNGSSCLPFEWENEIHLWTVKDAKDGDVLTYRVDDGKILIFIYECLGNSFDGEVDVHAGLDGDGYFSASTAGACCKFMDLLTPSTKEQRDILFQKMKEAGYEWDADKKELRGIKHL